VDDANAPIAGSAHYLGVVCGWPNKKEKKKKKNKKKKLKKKKNQ
jgi:hypothetical protein